MFLDKEREEYEGVIIVNESMKRLVWEGGKNVNVVQNRGERVLLVWERGYRYDLRKKKLSGMVWVGKRGIEGVIEGVWNERRGSLVEDVKDI